MTVTSFWHSEHGPTASLHNRPGNDRSSPLRELRWRAVFGASAPGEAWGSRPNVNLICCAWGWYTVSAIQMAKPPDPGVPHPSLQRRDLFFLAGDLDTLHSLAEVRESRNQYCPSLLLPTFPLSFAFYVSHHSFPFCPPSDSFASKKWKQCDVGVTICRLTPYRLTKWRNVPVHIYVFLSPYSGHKVWTLYFVYFTEECLILLWW